VTAASVVIANYNYARFLPQAIDSALGQTLPGTEVVVVDDGSTDESREIVAAYGDEIRSVLKPNGGHASALNAGFAASHGEIVCFIDADDMLLPGAMEAAAGALEPGVAKVHWAMWEVDSDGERTGALMPEDPLCEGDLREVVAARGPSPRDHGNPPCSGNAYSRTCLEAIMPVPQRFRRATDAYLFELAPFFGRIARLPEPQGLYRVHGVNDFVSMSYRERLAFAIELHGALCEEVAATCRRNGIDVDPDGWREDRWLRELASFAEVVDDALPAGEPFILADEGQLPMDADAQERTIPFPERDGVYWGRPVDDAAAVAELERLKHRGLRFIVFAWPAFWWLDHYAGLSRHLNRHGKLTFRDDKAIVFALD